MIFQRNTERFRHRIQLKTVEIRQQNPGKRHRIHNRWCELDTKVFAILENKTHIKIRVVRHHDAPLTKIDELRQNHINRRSILHHAVIDGGQLLNTERNRDLRIHECREFVRNFSMLNLHRTNLDNLVHLRGKSGCLDIKHNVIVIDGLIFAVGDNLLQIIHQICLHTVDDLKIIPAALHSVICIRKCLHIPMVGNRNCLVPPLHRALDDILHIRNTVHITHLCMTVKLHSLFRTGIHADTGKIRYLLDSRNMSDRQISIEFINRGDTLDFDKFARRNRPADLRQFLIFDKQLDDHRIGKIRHGKHENRSLIANLPAL